GPGAHGDAPARVLRTPVGGAAVELMDVRVATVTLTFADPMPTAFGVLRKRELLLMRLRDGDGNPAADLLERCRIVADVPQALAAVDLALWDLAGNREGKPVSELIS